MQIALSKLKCFISYLLLSNIVKMVNQIMIPNLFNNNYKLSPGYKIVPKKPKNLIGVSITEL